MADKNASWKTTAAAIATAISALAAGVAAYFDGDPTTVVDWSMMSAAGIGLLTAFGLWKAKDADK